MAIYTSADIRDYADSAYKEAGVVRKYTGADYITHCDEIVNFLHICELDEALIESLKPTIYLHDIIEDTDLTAEDLLAITNKRSVNEVIALTDEDATVTKRKRVVRKAADRERLGNADVRVQLVKVSDILSNAMSIVEHDDNFGPTFIDEAVLLLEKLTKVRVRYPDTYHRVHVFIHAHHRRYQSERRRAIIERVEGTALPTVKVPSLTVVESMDFVDNALIRFAQSRPGGHSTSKLIEYGINGNIFDKHNRPYLYNPSFLIARVVTNAAKFHLPAELHHYVDDPEITEVYGINPGCYSVKWSITHHDDLAFVQSVMVPVLVEPKWLTTPVPHWSFIDRAVEDDHYHSFADAGASLIAHIRMLQEYGEVRHA